MLFIFVSILGVVLWTILLLSKYFQAKGKLAQNFTPPVMGKSAGVHSIQGSRPHMEDTYQAAINIDDDPKHAFYAVYDGHGGPRCSDFAADRLHKELLHQPNLLNDPIQALEAAFRDLDHNWLLRASKNKYDDGSTAITSLILHNTVWYVGDFE
jgi:serine/threonine protein phosphatase PrpC